MQAACLLPNGQLGIVGSKSFAGLMPIGWKVVSVDSQETAGADNPAARAIDGDSSTFWHTRWNADQRQPHSITVDMGKTHRIGGFTYLPRQDGLLNGVVENYRFETSTDGTPLDDQHRLRHVRQHSEQSVSPGSRVCSGHRPLLPLHGLAGNQRKRLDERRRALRLAGQQGWRLTIWHSVTTSDHVPPRSWSKIRSHEDRRLSLFALELWQKHLHPMRKSCLLLSYAASIAALVAEPTPSPLTWPTRLGW